jgi:hypothetical protein
MTTGIDAQTCKLIVLDRRNQEPRRKRTGYESRFAPESQIQIAIPKASPQSGGEYIPYSIQSMTEFKQIIGRGTRINEEYHKLYFTIMDFKKATELFYDPEFDGNPVQVYEPQGNQPVVPPVEEEPTEERECGGVLYAACCDAVYGDDERSEVGGEGV